MRYGFKIALLLVLAGTALGAPKKPAPAKLDCMACHGEQGLSKEVDGKQHSISIDRQRFQGSVHGIFECTDCHKDVKAFPHDPAPAKVKCAECHADAEAAYQKSVHGKAVALKPGEHAPGCLDCHGDIHAVLPSGDPNSATHHQNIPKTCGNCHGEKFVMAQSGQTTQPVLMYAESVHGIAVRDGDQSHPIPGQTDGKSGQAAVCTDCHGNHDILPPSDPKSPIFKFNVPQTCGKCHTDISQQYAASIHGTAMQRGNWQAPVCTDCHGIHSIKNHLDPKSSVAAANLATVTCGNCHEGVRLTNEFGIPGSRASTYLDSYHGLASKLGSQSTGRANTCSET